MMQKTSLTAQRLFAWLVAGTCIVAHAIALTLASSGIVLAAVVASVSTLIAALAYTILVPRGRLRHLHFLIVPVFLLLAQWFFVMTLQLIGAQHLIWWSVGITALYIGIYTYVLNLYIHIRPRYQAHALENITSYINVVCLFFTATSLYALQIFINAPAWVVMVTGTAVVAVLTYAIMWVSDIVFSTCWRYIVLVSLLMLEVITVMTFLPITVFARGAIVAIMYYALVGIVRNQLLRIHGPAVIRRYAVITAFALALILLTADWI